MSDRRRRAWILAALTLLGGLLRFWRLDQLPPGLWFDEAWVSVVARDWGNEIYFAASFGGMHPAVVYLTRLARLFTPSPLAIRFALAAVGTLTIPLAYAALRAVFALDEWRSSGRLRQEETPTPSPEWTALLAAAVLAVLYPFFHFSRLGFESSLPAPASLLAFWGLAILLRRRRSGWFRPALLTGLALGLSLYTFDTGRFIPLAAALAYGLFWLVYRPQPLGPAFGRFAVLTAAAVVIAGPLLGYFWLHRDQLFARALVTTTQTFGPEAGPFPLLANLGRTLAGLSLPGFGDRIARHNLPGRPVLDPGLSLLFWVGIAASLRRWWQPSRLLLLSWLACGLLPVVLTDGAPTYTRLFVAVPPLAALAAVGGEALWRRRSGRGPAALIAASLLVALAATTVDYFVRWAALPALYDDFQVGQWEGARLALELSASRPVYFLPERAPLAEPTYDLLLAGSAVRPIPPAPCTLLPPAGEAAVYLVDERADLISTRTLQALFPEAVSAPAVFSPVDQTPLFRRLDLPAGTPLALPGEPADARFAPGIRLHRWIFSGDQLTLLWEVEHPPAGDITLFVHLYPEGETERPPLAQVDRPACFPSGRWQAGDRLLDSFRLPLPADLPSGRYILALGWYHFPSFERLPLEGDPAAALDSHRLRLTILERP